MEHPWYGYPSQVWSCTQHSQIDFLHIEKIISRVVYTEAPVDFGRFYGCCPVIIVTPIEYEC